MKRFHVHVGVENLERSIGFYSDLFGARPTVVKLDYAKWMLDDPRVNFAISSGQHSANGVEHLGIQAEDETELALVYGRLRTAGRPILEEGATTCCYSQSEKNWISDPDGVVWEAFLTTGEAVVYGESPSLEKLAGAPPRARPGACCAPDPQTTAGPAPDNCCN
jgi:catechol 2,3-dioxygenase-like lactoylglutathione lyase family enzyme